MEVYAGSLDMGDLCHGAFIKLRGNVSHKLGAYYHEDGAQYGKNQHGDHGIVIGAQIPDEHLYRIPEIPGPFSCPHTHRSARPSSEWSRPYWHLLLTGAFQRQLPELSVASTKVITLAHYCSSSIESWDNVSSLQAS